jgi:phosphoglycolate phosphatase
MIRLLTHLQHKKHIIFDYNGTILYDTPICVEALNLLLDSHGLPTVSEAYYRDHFHFPISSFYQSMGFDFQRESFDDLGRRYMSYYFENLHRCRIYEGMRELLVALRYRPIKTSILTALNHQLLHDQLQIFKLAEYFDAAFGLPDQRAHSKVQRGRDLMDHVGVAAHECLIIGDTDHDLEVGTALGIDVILLADGHQSEERLQKAGAMVINLERQVELNSEGQTGEWQ